MFDNFLYCPYSIETKDNLYQEELKHAEDLFAGENSILIIMQSYQI